MIARRRGQSTVEYLFLVAVFAVALAVAAYAFLPGFSEGADALGSDVTTLLHAGTQDGGGDRR